MANYVYPFVALTGGAGGALDAIDGAGLADLDMAYGSIAGYTYTYLLDVDSAVAEASPIVIAPDTNGGDKRWILQGINSGGVNRYCYSAALADDASIALPTITANFSGHGFIQVSSSGVINESAEFEIDSTGDAALIRATANVIVGADTDGKVCIGTADNQNPMSIKNRLGGARNVMIVVDWH